MKIRTITYGLHVSVNDFLENDALKQKFDSIQSILADFQSEFDQLSHVIQTTRVSLNSFEEWLIPLINDHGMSLEEALNKITTQLTRLSISLCSVGYCSTLAGIELLPKILTYSTVLHGSVLFPRISDAHIAPDYEVCRKAAEVSLKVHETCGDVGNFRYCASFNCKSGTPFFPVSYHEGTKPAISIGFENGDLLFLAFQGVTNHEKARSNLIDIQRQIYAPIQAVAQAVCDKHGVEYRGIDASINPGLSIPDSLAIGLETQIYPIEKTHFGSMGTLAAVSTVTSAVKALANEENGIKLVGYNGLMLPVMEDLRLSELANQQPAPYSVRDLLTLSSVCSVGLDTIPIPGNTSIDELAGVYMEVGAMAFRLNKPLSCRLLPMSGKVAGDVTAIESQYLCNTRVFPLNR